MIANYQVIARKFRPQKFSEVIGQEFIVTTLINSIKSNRLAHAYLFSGGHGTGKTTLARLFAKALNCQHRDINCEPCGSCSSCCDIASSQSMQVLEIDGASNRGIDDIRQINETACFASLPNQYKIFIIDEVHMLTKEAFNALLKTLEEPPAQVKFFFATTEPHKVPSTILSRCQRYDLTRIAANKIEQNLLSITKSLNLTIEEEVCHSIANLANGSLRDAQSLLDQVIAFSGNPITIEKAHEILGLLPKEHFFELDTRGKEQDLEIALQLIQKIYEKGINPEHFLESLAEHFRNLLLVKILKKNVSPLHIPDSLWEKTLKSASYYTKDQCLDIIESILETQKNLKTTLSQRLSLEWLLIDIIRSHQKVSIDKILSYLETPLNDTKPTLQEASSPITTEQNSSLSRPPQLAESLKKKLIPPLEKPTELLKEDERKKQNRYDTLMQFAAVELEGTLNKNYNKE